MKQKDNCKFKSWIYIWLVILTIVAFGNPHFIQVEKEQWDITYDNHIGFPEENWWVAGYQSLNFKNEFSNANNGFRYNPDRISLECTKGHEHSMWRGRINEYPQYLYVYTGEGTCILTYYEYQPKLVWGFS